MVQIFRRCFLANFNSCGRRAIVPSSFMISQSTPMGRHSASVHQVHRRLGVAGALQHAAGPRAQRKHMAGLDQVLGHGGRRRHDLDGFGAVGGADAGGDAARGVHAHLEIGAETFPVLPHHALDAELLQPLGRSSARKSARGRTGP